MGVITAGDSGLEYRGRYDPYVVQVIKQIPGRVWDPKRKVWRFPANLDVLRLLDKVPQIDITAEARAIIQRKQEAEMMAQSVKEDDSPEPVKPMPIKVKPFAHQVKGFNIGITLDNAGLLMEQGCGKSLTAVAIAGRRYLDGQVKRVLVVAPLSVLPVWQREFKDYADYPHDVRVLNSSIEKRIAALAGFPDDVLQVAVINYEAVWREEMFKALRKWHPDMIIADESQKIKGPSTKQSKGMHRLGEVAKYKLILTGTPVTASPMDFFSQYKFLDPDIFGKSYYAFRNRYAVMGGYKNKQVVGYQNKDELIRKAHSIAYRITKAEALDLPETVDQELYCSLEHKANQYYQEMVNFNVAQIEAENKQGRQIIATNVLTRLLRLQQITGGFLPRDDNSGKQIQVSSAKLNLLQDILEDVLGAGKKVVIFARFIPEIHAIEDVARKIAGDNSYYAITGAVGMEDRGKAVEEFQNNPAVKICIAQIQTAGLGITLTAADTGIFYSMDFSYANYDQAKARLHRIGQQNKVTYIHLLAQGTVDEKVYNVLKQKKSVADDVVDNWRQYFRVEE